MKLRSILPLLLLAGASFAKDHSDFPLQVHVVRVDAAQGQNGVSGSGNTDSNGDYHANVGGGNSYLYKLYTVHIDGDGRELTMTTPRSHLRGGTGLLIATMGYSAFASKEYSALHIGDYKGRWNKDGSLEIVFTTDKGKVTHQPFFVQAEAPLPVSSTKTP